MNSNDQESIGEVTMLEDRTILLKLRAENESMIGDSMFTISPDDHRYSEILEHVGPISPGETKPVPPWENAQKE